MGNTPQICLDYKESEECESDALNVAQNPNNPGWTDPPGCNSYYNDSVVRCSCAWNGTIEEGNCVLKKESPQSSGGGNGQACTHAKCTYTAAPASECVNGYATVYLATNYTKGDCVGGITEEQCLAGGGERIILCGRPSIALSFFDKWQFISAILVILVIYLIIYAKKRK